MRWFASIIFFSEFEGSTTINTYWVTAGSSHDEYLAFSSSRYPPILELMTDLLAGQIHADLPNEIWLYIMEISVQPCASDCHEYTTFFPPGINLTLLHGLKNTCRRLRALALRVEFSMCDQLITVRYAEDVRKLSIAPDDLRHLEILDSSSSSDSWKFKALFRLLVNIESLSIIFSTDTDIFTSCLAILPLRQSLRRLHLTSWDTDLCHLALDFPNLVELQLSRIDPREMTLDPSSFMLETFTNALHNLSVTSILSWLAEGLKKSLIKLQRLRLLSLHISLATLSQYGQVYLYHKVMHKPDVCTAEDCKTLRGFQVLETQKLLQREKTASEGVARYLPELERIRWVDIWKVDHHQEELQREYRIDRSDDGIILPVLCFKPTPSSLAPVGEE